MDLPSVYRKYAPRLNPGTLRHANTFPFSSLPLELAPSKQAFFFFQTFYSFIFASRLPEVFFLNPKPQTLNPKPEP